MNFQDSDIDFNRITWRQFEELCFDLVMKYQFHDIVWHQGSADGGRDIEAEFTVVNSLFGLYSERWFFECKFYSGGVPMDELVSKIGWAAAHRVKHFVLLTNTHPTKDTRDYLSKIQESSDFKIHVLDGKMIKAKLLPFPDVVTKYFADDTAIWIKNLMKQWVFQDTLPEVKTLSKLAQVVDPEKLTKEELVFLMFAYDESEYNELWLPDGIEPFTFDFLWPEITKNVNVPYPIDLEREDLTRAQVGWNNLRTMSTETKELDQYTYIAQHRKPAIGNTQILLRRHAKQITVKIAHSTFNR